MFYKQTPLYFSCTGCGRCCLGHPDDNVIELVSGEVERISQFLKLQKDDFIRQYGVDLENGEHGITIGRKGRCTFLQKDNTCSIYAVRPLQCQAYPYWPEIMVSKTLWDNEASRCEGINSGKRVEISLIEKQLFRFDPSN